MNRRDGGVWMSVFFYLLLAWVAPALLLIPILLWAALRTKPPENEMGTLAADSSGGPDATRREA